MKNEAVRLDVWDRDDLTDWGKAELERVLRAGGIYEHLPANDVAPREHRACIGYRPACAEDEAES